MNFGSRLFFAAVAFVAPAVMHAATVSSNPSLGINGLSFNNFTCSISKGGVYATPGNCNQINVNTITQPGSGIEFSSGFTAAPFSFDDAVIHYDVSSSDGISAVGLDFNGFFLGLGISSVTESVYHNGNLVGFAEVACSPLGCNRSDSILLNGIYNNLHIIKDINVTGVFGFAQISVIDQTFTTTPEPSTTALMGAGLLAAGIFFRRRNTRNQTAVA